MFMSKISRKQEKCLKSPKNRQKSIELGVMMYARTYQEYNLIIRFYKNYPILTEKEFKEEKLKLKCNT